VPDETLRAGPLPRLANRSSIHATSEEVIADFSFAGAPNLDGAPAIERVVLTWPAAKRLLLTLQQAVVQYEKDFGSIDPNPARRPIPNVDGNA
jgi:hypothetical protein